MRRHRPTVYPYIPNSVPAVQEAMLREIGAKSVDECYADIPEALRVRGDLDIPEPLLSEEALRRHVEGLLSRNVPASQVLSFLGAGCYGHAVPAVCDEVNGRGEFLTAYAGEPYDDHGRFQALFEYASLMGELLEMDVVNVPTYDGYQAAATALRMACRITRRREVLVSRAIAPDKLSKIRGYCAPDIEVRLVGFDPSSGALDLAGLRKQVSARTAAVYFENPSYLGTIEARGDEVAALIHKQGGLSIVAVDPITLGVLAPPAEYGADIVVGDLQPLGMHMQFGGGQAGFIATRDDPTFVMEYPSRLFGLTSTRVEGEYGFGDVAYGRTSFAVREGGKEWVGTAAALWGITAGVYLALMGPQGMRELGEGILQRAHYAASRLAKVPGLRAPALSGPFFQEFVVDYRGARKTATAVHRGLRRRGIFGGVDLGGAFPEFAGCVLACVTETHTKADIDRFAEAVREVVEA